MCAFGLLVASVAAWAAPHKLRVNDPAVTRALIAGGGRLIADYGSFQVVETEATALVSVGGQTQDEDESDSIELNVRRLNTRTAEAVALRKPTSLFVGRRLHLVHFASPIKPEWKAELEQGGARVVCYIPHNAYLIYGDAVALASLQSWSTAGNIVQWEGEYADDYKIHPRARLIDTNGQPRQLETDVFAIQLVDDAESNAQTLALINQLKLSPEMRQFHSLDYLNVIVRLPPNRLTDIAGRPEVVSIQPYIEPRLRDERQDQIVAGNLLGNSPSGPGYLAWLAAQGFTQSQFSASGFAVDVTDSGVDNGTSSPGHFGLYQSGDPLQASRVIYNRVEGTPNPGSSLEGCDGHGNLNTHIIAGYNDLTPGFPHTDAAGFHYGLGVCPFVEVGSSVIFDPNNYTFPSFANLQSRAYHDGARISANSWGANVNGVYNADSQAYDALVRDAQPSGSAFAAAGNQQMVIVFAAGNAGSGATTVNSPGSGKNVITVGAAENVNSHSTANGGNNPSGNDGCNIADSGANSAGDIATFSSRGPCTDGRMKPDLVAPGTHITGGVAQNSPPVLSGTGSAIACFIASGVCALPGGGTAGNANNFFPLGQQFYTTSSGTSHSTPAVAGACALLRQHFINNSLTPPSPAMTKAFLMNSTRYLTGVGANDTLWSANQGMGELNLGTAFDNTARIVRDQLSSDKFTASGQTRIITGTVADPSKPFRITLAWTDAPGSTSGNAYNNDLDLTLTIGGIAYKGNVFSGAFSVPGGTADAKNNVESIFLPAGVSNTFAVTVTAANINSDGVPNEAPSLDQDFALVIYNATQVPLPVIAPSGLGLVGEGCSPTNGAVDPGETVTISLALKNIGTGDATNLVVTLLPTNGVVAPDGPQTYGVLAAGGAPASREFSFTANGSCGGAITASFQVQDGTENLGTISQTISLGSTTFLSVSRTNATPMNIPGSGTTGPASVYPSTISVSGITGTVTKVTASLRGLTHTFPDDIDVLLVGPQGQKVLLMSDAGGGNGINNIVVTFDDNASASLPNSGQVNSGTFRPTNFDTSSDGFPSPAPGGPFSSTLSAFNRLDPNGTWSLYVRDDRSSDSGSLAQGWTLTLNTSNLVCCSGPVNLADLVITDVVAPTLLNVGSNLTFSLLVTNVGPSDASSVIVVDTLPLGVGLISAVSSQGNCTNNGQIVTCNLGAMSNGATATIVISAMAGSAGVLTNQASVSGAPGDPVANNNSAPATVSINAFPGISDIPDQITDEDTAIAAIPFMVSDAETPAGSLVLSKSCSNTNLVPLVNIGFGGGGSNRTISIVPAPNASGSATITVGVSDGLASVSDSFVLTVNAVNDPPVLAAIANFTIAEGQTLAFTNHATDIESPPESLTFNLANAPANALLNPTTGVFTWTPNEAQGPGTNLISVMVTDNGVPSQSATQAFTIVVLESNSVPTLAAISNCTILEGELLTFTNIAADADLPVNRLTFTLGNAPTNATIDPTNGVFAWTPNESQGPGTNIISVIVMDDGKPILSATQTFTVIVLESNSPPVLAPLQATLMDLTIVKGQTLTLTNLANDPDIPPNELAFSLDAGTGPEGAEINATNGVFSWTPGLAQSPGTNRIMVIVSDNGVPSLSATQSFLVVVLETNNPPVLNAIPDQTIAESETLVITNMASDQDVPVNVLTFRLDTNTAPMGATINATNGVFIWTPGEAQGPGTNLITVIVTDDGVPNLSATRSFVVVVLETNSAPSLGAISNYTIFEGEELVLTNLASDSDLPANTLTFHLESNSAPVGAAINATNGVFTWRPTEAQGLTTNSIYVVVTDDGVPSLSATQSFTVVVLKTNSAPLLGVIPDYVVFEGELLVVTNVASDGDLPPNILTFMLDTNTAPAGAEINATNGLFTWTPGEGQGPSTNLISVVVTDDGVPSMSATQHFSVVVLETNSAPVLNAIADQTIIEGETLVITNVAGDGDFPANVLTFSLETNSAPAGAWINATNGVISWTPSEAQGPGTNVITVIVTDDGVPSLSATQHFTVAVLETNSPPMLSPVADQILVLGETLSLTNVASDPDLPVNALAFHLDPVSAPPGAEINATNGILTWTPSGAQAPSTNHITIFVSDDGIPSLSVTQSFMVVVVVETNHPPVLGAISDRTIIEGEMLVISNSASDIDVPANTLTFSLDTNTVPFGAAINATSGVFAWTPSEAQGPGTNVITVIVTDDGVPHLSATQSFTVVVLETNSAPKLAGIANRTVHAGSLVVISNSATDPDIPANTVAFSLDPGGPPGGTIDSTSGVFTWATSESNASTTNSFTVRVTDNGVPPLDDTRSFSVFVVSRPFIQMFSVSNKVVDLTWSAVAGQKYRVQYQSNLTQTNWIDLLPEVTAGASSATNTHVVGLEAQRFYRVMLVP